MKILNILYILFVVFLVFFSYSFVDQNFPLHSPIVARLTTIDRLVKTLVYVGYVIAFFIFYIFFLKKITKTRAVMRNVWFPIFLNSILLFSYPSFSFDIFNYIATSKVAFLYGENPYVVMPIELSNEPLLVFMHAANKTALYGMSWILLTAIPFFAGFNNLFLTILTFKLFIFIFYIGTCYLIFLLSKKDVIKLAFFALNPLVVIETLVSGHNDIVMVFFALLGFFLIGKKIYILALTSILISIFIKYATVFILPIFLYAFFRSLNNKEIDWNKIWFYSFLAMLCIFILSPVREELYSWYFIWPFTFLVLTKDKKLFKMLSIVFSFGLLMRFTPFIYTGGWGGITPLIKHIVTFGSLLLGFVTYPFLRKRYL